MTKKQKKQKPVANHGNQPVASNNLSLREAARKLQKLRPAETISNTTAYDLLLKELRAGALYAGFYAANAWIEIPPDHWAYVTTTQLKDIVSNDKHPGTFTVSARDFSHQIAAALVKSADALPETTGAVTAFVSASHLQYEPEIPHEVWQTYLEKSGASDLPAKTLKRRSGNTENPKWVDLAAHVLGYCLAKEITSQSPRSGIHDDVVAKAKKKGVDTARWPGSSSTRDFLGIAWDFAKHLEHQHKS